MWEFRKALVKCVKAMPYYVHLNNEEDDRSRLEKGNLRRLRGLHFQKDGARMGGSQVSQLKLLQLSHVLKWRTWACASAARQLGGAADSDPAERSKTTMRRPERCELPVTANHYTNTEYHSGVQWTINAAVSVSQHSSSHTNLWGNEVLAAAPRILPAGWTSRVVGFGEEDGVVIKGRPGP